MSSSCIRPVAGSFPVTKELWDDTNLPMCVVVTPLHSNNKDDGDDDDSQEEVLVEKDDAEDEEEDDSPEPTTMSLAAIPKCLNCGAPHPTQETHFRPAKRLIMLCYFCGETSSLRLKDQQAARIDEKLDAENFDRVVCKEGEDHTFDIPISSGEDDDDDDEDNGGGIDRLPAMACPPVWWIVLDASQTSRHDYWTAVGTALETVLADIPPYVHVGMIAAGETKVSSWDLSSPVPHVIQYPYSCSDVDFCLVPADALHSTSIQSAVRAAADAHASGTLGGSSGADGDDTGMALATSIELILEYMEQAVHPGDNPQEDEEDEEKPKTALKYAGGKILCLLGNPPAEISTKPVESQPEYYQGGIAGACSPYDKWEGTFLPESEPTDMTPKNLATFADPLDPEDLFEAIGTRCATAAFGVDLLVVVPEYGDDADEDALRTAIRPWYGLPLMRILAESSGAPGPIMVGSQDVPTLEEHILARAPWQSGMAFSSELRIRLPPDFSVEDTPVERIGKDAMQVATFLSSSGVAGPAVGIDDGLWLMGTCDATTTLTIDLEVGNEVQEEFNLDGIGEIPAKHLIQICFAYTCIEVDEDGNAYTVRKMKVACREMPVVAETEEIFDSLDPEALIVPLFHKLCLNAIQEGLEAAQDTGIKWLVSLLVCVYQSAIVELARIEELKEEQGDMVETGSTFVASERLLDQEGDSEIEDVLLGQGHEKIAQVATLIYSLLQCDALRPTCGSFEPSMDARCAAMAQMACMSPSELRKCVAPMLQLWSTEKDEAIVESLSLNKQSIQDALEEAREAGCLLFMDSPQGIIVCRAEYLAMSKSVPKGKVEVGPNLEAVLEEAADSYRTRPDIQQELEPKSSKLAKLMENYLVEDKGLASGIQDFAEWRVEVAGQVQESLEANGDLEVEEEE